MDIPQESGLPLPDYAAATERLTQQLAFIREIDKVKSIFRKTYLVDGTRLENDAEHSWHLAVMAILLAEYALPHTDIIKTLKMVLVHDLVEIDAGDVFLYDTKGTVQKAAKEILAAERIFGILPKDQAIEFRGLWEEFEAKETNEAKFGAALDRLQPLLHNFYTRGMTWREFEVSVDMVIPRNEHMGEGAPALWEYAQQFIKESVAKGYLRATK